MPQEQELAILRRDLAEARCQARQYENRVTVSTNIQWDKECRDRTLRLIEHRVILENVLAVKDVDSEKSWPC